VKLLTQLESYQRKSIDHLLNEHSISYHQEGEQAHDRLSLISQCLMKLDG